mmetsp:Transcript_5790/g.16235  ORF Transcript_5790/g.16235 Transcript_5790/m.16235 type:complete len:200 (+) Transcript_5790:674-1273(+)
MLFQIAWFTDPVFRGDYPPEMRARLGDRLPRFSERVFSEDPTWSGYWADIGAELSSDPAWEKNDMGWSTVADGLREMLSWISHRYSHPMIVITENGSAEHEPDLRTALNDEKRRSYFEGHIRACGQAIERGVNLQGYFAWSLMDNFEWQFGYKRRFGLCYVDFDSLERTPKASALFYRDVVKSRGRKIERKDEVNWFPL